jgi:Na+-translocating ferredoxin:NAD+ oxidoreductase subunit G
MLVKSISKNSLLLSLFAVCCTAMITLCYMLTIDSIREQERIIANKALLEIFPESTHDNNILDDIISSDQVDFDLMTEGEVIHVARQGERLVGYIFPVQSKNAYSNDIKLLIGISVSGNLKGVRVIQHNETPGLGDAIEIKKSDWITHFNNKSLLDPEKRLWKIKKDGGSFDQFTGASITPRSIVNTVYKTLVFYNDNHELLLSKLL